MGLHMADTTINTAPEDELFDVEGEAETADDDSLDASQADEIQEQIVDLGAGEGDSVAEGNEDPKAGGEDYGAKVSARINKLTGHHNQAIAEKNREIASLKRQAFDAHGAALDISVSSLTSKVEDIEGRIKTALEDGDTDAQVQLNSELTDAKIDLRSAEGRRGPVRPKPAAGEDGAEAGAAEPASPKDPLAALQPKAKGWAERVGFTGWTDAQRGLALGIDSELTKEGFDQNTDDYFEELDRRVGQLYPDLYASDDEEDPAPTPRPKVEPTVRAQSPITPKPGKGSGNQVKLGAADYANMRKFKLDPSNPEHVKAYAVQKRSG